MQKFKYLKKVACTFIILNLFLCLSNVFAVGDEDGYYSVIATENELTISSKNENDEELSLESGEINRCLGGIDYKKTIIRYDIELYGGNGITESVYCLDKGKRANGGGKFYKIDGPIIDYMFNYLLSDSFLENASGYNLSSSLGEDKKEYYNLSPEHLRQLCIWAYNKTCNSEYHGDMSFYRNETLQIIIANAMNNSIIEEGVSVFTAEDSKAILGKLFSHTEYDENMSLYIFHNNNSDYQRLIGKLINPKIPEPIPDEPEPDKIDDSIENPEPEEDWLYIWLKNVVLTPKYFIDENSLSGSQNWFDFLDNEWQEVKSTRINTEPDPAIPGIDSKTGLPILVPSTTSHNVETTITYTIPSNHISNNINRLTGTGNVGGSIDANNTCELKSDVTSHMRAYAYYGSRYIFQRYFGNSNIIYENSISERYRATVVGSFKQKYDEYISSATGYIDDQALYSCDPEEKIYVNDNGYNKYSNLEEDCGFKNWATTNQGGVSASDESPEYFNKKVVLNTKITGYISDAYKIYFNYTFEPSSIIRVNHYVEDTDGNHTKDGKNYKRDDSIANDNEIGTIQEISGDELHELPKGYSERKTVYDWGNNGDSTPKTEWFGGCSEQYEIDASDRMSINRSSTILKDGYYYKCIGVSIGNGGIQTNRSLEVGISGDDGDQTINYYYEKVPYSVVEDPNDDYPDDDTPGRRNQLPGNKEGIEISKLKFAAVSSESRSYDKFLNETTFSQSGNISYVPAKENLRAYLEASIVKPKNLKYKIKVGGYDVERYTAYGIDDTYNVGSVNGINGSARENVYNGNTTSIHSAKQDEIKNSVYNSKNDLADDSYEVFNGTPVSTDSNIVGKLNKITYKYQTSKDYFKTDSDQYVNDNKYNGLRNPTGAIYYKEYDVMNHQKYGPTYTKKVSDSDTMDVNVYTPFDIGKVSIKSSNEVVDHSVEAEKNGLAVIQQNADFTLEVLSNEDGACYQNLYTKVGGHNGYNFLHKYLQYFYVKLDFDVKITNGNYRVWTVNGSGDSATATKERWARVGDVLEKGTIIRLVPNNGVGILKANAYSTGEDTSKVNYNKYKAYASTVNMPNEDWVVNQIAKSSYTSADSGTGTPYIDNKQVVLHGEDRSYQSVSGLKKDAFYIVSNLKKTVSLGRIFDFEITDCADVNFKNVFRKSETNTVNDLTGIAYYSGFYRLRLRDEWTGYNINYYTNRDEKSGITYGYVKTVLPLGPYKNISNEYMSAPKLGYRFSFDVKTSGYYDPLDEDKYSTDRRIEITPSYYYISKDGSKLIDNVKLYYKNSSGNYIPFENSGYTISYKPNDGYRTLLTDDTTSVKDGYLTSNLKTLNISKMFTLTGKDMITMSDHGFIQSWYGEFKLPNSTIILEKDQNGNVNINNPLKDGYIAVKFDMKCIDTYKDVSGSKQTVTIEYNKNNANDSRDNTTQWDYEGYLGFDVNRQNINDLKLQLEKGTYSVGTQDRYDQIKGTVALFDIDNRAADDFN